MLLEDFKTDVEISVSVLLKNECNMSDIGKEKAREMEKEKDEGWSVVRDGQIKGMREREREAVRLTFHLASLLWNGLTAFWFAFYNLRLKSWIETSFDRYAANFRI